MFDWSRFKTEEEAVRCVMAEKGVGAGQARKYLYANIPKESDIQRRIMKRIREVVPSAFVWKAAAGPYSRSGIPDICAIVNGHFYAFEVKRPLIGAVSPMQAHTIRRINEQGGRAFVVTCPAEAEEILMGERRSL